MTIQQRLAEMNIVLPIPAAPVAAYVPCVEAGGMLYVSGQLPVMNDGTMIKGRLGEDMTIEAGADAARMCALNILAQANGYLGGDLSRLKRCVKLGAFVASTPTFYDHPKVVNGASEFMLSVMGDAGKHARFALGVAALPFGVAVEIDAVFELA